MTHPEHAEFDLRFDAMLIAPRRTATPSVSGIRRQHLTTRQPPSKTGSAHAIEHRRPDGPHRAHQHQRRFDLCACCWRRRSAATASPITPPTSCRCAARTWSRRCRSSACATRSAIISPSASQARQSRHRSTWCCCGRIRRSISPTSPARISSSASIPRRWSSTIRPACATRRKNCS